MSGNSGLGRNVYVGVSILPIARMPLSVDYHALLMLSAPSPREVVGQGYLRTTIPSELYFSGPHGQFHGIENPVSAACGFNEARQRHEPPRIQD